MKKFISIIIILAVSYQAWVTFSPRFSQLKPLYKEPYVVVYGQDACSFTQNALNELRKANKKPIYKKVNVKSVSDELFSRMKKSGLQTRHFLLPVIDVNSKLLIRPDMKVVLNHYEEPLAKNEPRDDEAVFHRGGSLQVSGIISGKKIRAIVDGNVVKKGDRIGVYVIKKIGKDFVKFQDANGKVLTKNVQKN